VDDDELTRSTLTGLLSTFGGINVRGAEDGDKAYHQILEQRPDLILCDLQMPVLDGFGFIERLRRDPRFRRILTFAVSGLGRPIDITMTRAAGFDGHIVKPVTAEALARLLDRALDRRNAQEGDQGV
jgi:CheY-like chemotaxis protein